VTERNVSLLFNGKLDIGHSGALLPVEETERLGIFDKVCTLIASFAANISS
jgi:hypothetical protein